MSRLLTNHSSSYGLGTGLLLKKWFRQARGGDYSPRTDRCQSISRPNFSCRFSRGYGSFSRLGEHSPL